MLKSSPKAVATTKKGNIPFLEADLAIIILASVPITWQNQYSLTHLMVLEAPQTLLPDLENIEHIMLKKYNKKLQAQVKATTAHADGKGKPKKGTSEKGSSHRVPKKAPAEKFYARLTVSLTRRTTRVTVVTTTRKASPLGIPRESFPERRSPTSSLGARRASRT
jgi:hypothetical protein